MRIFYASDTTPNSALKSNLWRNNLYLPLVNLGHDVVEFDYDLRETFQNFHPADPRQKAFIEVNREEVTGTCLATAGSRPRIFPNIKTPHRAYSKRIGSRV